MALQISPLSIDLRSVLQGRQDRQNFEAGQQRNRLTELALQQAPARMQAEQEAQQLQQQRGRLQFSQEQEQAVGTALGGAALQMLQPLSQGDFQGAEAILDQTAQQLSAVGLQMPEGPLRQALRTRNTDAIKGILSSTITSAQQRGWLKGPEKPAALPAGAQLAEWYASATPEQREAFEATQRTSAAGGTPYIAPVPTSEGLLEWNYRTGERRPVMSPEGRAYMPPAIDPGAQGAVASAKAAGTVTGKAGAEAQVNLPQTLATAEQSLQLIDQALAHPGLNTATGLQGKVDPRNYVPGTDARNFQVLLDQLGGKAFLEAFESLKGGGQITEVEGRKATEAIARLNRSQSTEEFRRSLEELRNIVELGALRAQAKAGRAQQTGAAPAAPQPARVGRFVVEVAD